VVALAALTEEISRVAARMRPAASGRPVDVARSDVGST
jgi:hypothetical protein